jgi:hypothetical protein
VASEGSEWTELGEVGWPGREASGVNGGQHCYAGRLAQFSSTTPNQYLSMHYLYMVIKQSVNRAALLSYIAEALGCRKNLKFEWL